MSRIGGRIRMWQNYLSKIIMKALSPDTGQLTFKDEDGAVDILRLKGKELINFRKKNPIYFSRPF